MLWEAVLPLHFVGNPNTETARVATRQESASNDVIIPATWTRLQSPARFAAILGLRLRLLKMGTAVFIVSYTLTFKNELVTYYLLSCLKTVICIVKLQWLILIIRFKKLFNIRSEYHIDNTLYVLSIYFETKKRNKIR